PQDLAPEDLLRRPDVADAREQLVEVVPAAGTLEPFVVEGEALDDVLAQPLGRPDAELGAAVRPHAVADGDDDVEVEVVDLSRDLPVSLPLNRCKFCNGCLAGEFALLEDVLNVARNDRFV